MVAASETRGDPWYCLIIAQYKYSLAALFGITYLDKRNMSHKN